MSIEDILGHVTPVGGNIFLDLGFPQEEADYWLKLTVAPSEIRHHLLAMWRPLALP